jgi:hypothetical protein
VRLDPADIEAIARRVAELIDERGALMPVRYVDATQLARILGVDREWIYRHAHRLGPIRLGAGRGRLRFDLKHTTRVLADPATEPARRTPAMRPARRRAAPRSAPVDLLPYES